MRPPVNQDSPSDPKIAVEIPRLAANTAAAIPAIPVPMITGHEYAGEIVEEADVRTIFKAPRHPYTQGLLAAVPSVDPERRGIAVHVAGDVPSPASPPSGCRFHTRCPRRTEFLPDGGKICEMEKPPWQQNGSGHRILCHIPIDKLMEIEPVVHKKDAAEETTTG